MPNSFEKYLNKLRIYTSFSILKHGILPKHLKNLKKIYLAEAFLFKSNTKPTDIRLLSHNLLYCVKNKKDIDFIIDIKQILLINQKLYKALILTLANNSNILKVEFRDGIVIKGNGKIKSSKKIIHFLGGYSFYNLKTSEFIIVIPCNTTPLSPAPTITQWELIFDKFSPFNLFFEN